MKYFIQLLSFTILTTVVSSYSINIHADDSATKTKDSAHSYKSSNFCDGPNGAEQVMTELEKENQKKFEKIKIFKDEITDLIDADKLVSAIRDIKNRYTKSMNEISQSETELVSAIGHARSARIDGQVLSAAHSKKAKQKNLLLNGILSNIQEKTDSLNPGLAQETQERIVQITTPTSNDISPEDFDNLLRTNSPTILSMIEKNLKEKDLRACLDNSASVDICNKIGIDPTKKDQISQTLKNEFTALSQQVQNRLSSTKSEQPSINNEKKFEAIKQARTEMEGALKKLVQFSVYESMESQSDFSDSNTQVQEGNYEKVKNQIALKEKSLTGMDIFFYNFPPNLEEYLTNNSIDINTKEGVDKILLIQESHIETASQNAKTFNESCDFSKTTFSNINDNLLKNCGHFIEQVMRKIDNLKNSHIDKIAELNSKIKKLASEDNFGDIESLKKYVAEKYMCSCNKEKKSLKINENSESLIFTGESCSTEFITLSKIEGLSDASNIIAKTLYANKIKVPMDNESCVKSPEDLKPFAKTCESNQVINSQFSELCKQIKSEYTVKAISDQRRTKANKDWEKINNENYVEYVSGTESGYSTVKKKGKAQIFGNGILPVIPRIIPMWLGNFQMQNNINMLTTQGMMQKQYLHNAGIFNQSPWMNNFNGLGYGNPFMSFPTSQPGNSTLGGSNGFNFSQ